MTRVVIGHMLVACVGIDAGRYSNLCEAEEFNWQCPSCLFNAWPYHDVVTDANVDEDSSDVRIYHNMTFHLLVILLVSHRVVFV